MKHGVNSFMDFKCQADLEVDLQISFSFLGKCFQVLLSDNLHQGSNAPSVRSPVVDKARTRPGYWPTHKNPHSINPRCSIPKQVRGRTKKEPADPGSPTKMAIKWKQW